MGGHSAAEIEALIERHAWVRELARSLVIDADAADDLVQEAWIAALERGPTRDPGFRGWLAKVVRNLARQRWRANARRAAHERGAAVRDRALSSSSEHFETYEFLVNAVGELDEPYKTAVILRYFEELTPRQIAERLDVPLGTVETRLHRALERLRAKLDRRCGDRATWIAFVAPLAELSKSSGGALAWSWIVKTQTKLAVAMVALVLLSLVAFFALRSASDAQAERTAETAATPKLGDADAKLAKSSAPSERSVLATPAEATVSIAPEAISIHGVVVDCEDRVLAEVKVGVRTDESSPSSVQTTSDADGRFTLSPVPTSGLIDSVDERFVGVLRPRFEVSSRELEQVLVVAPRRSLHGIVENAEDAPIGGAGVRVELAWGFRERFGRSLIESETRVWTAKCDANGVFAIDDLPDLADSQVRAKAFGYQEAQKKLGELPKFGVVLHLPDTRIEGPTLAGSVIDEHGRGIAGAIVEIDNAVRAHRQFKIPNHVSTDANGDFHVGFAEGAPYERVVARAFAAGRLPVEIVREGSDATQRASWPSPLVFQLDRRTKSIAGRVLESDGKPVAGCALWIEDPTPFGNFSATAEPQASGGDVNLESLLAGSTELSFVRDGTHALFTTDRDGRFEVRGLLERSYQVVALDPDHLRFAVTPAVDAGSNGIELTMPSIDSGRRVAGHVVDLQGKPVGGVELTICGRESASIDAMNRTIPATGRRELSDAGGRFEFTGIHATGLELLARPTDKHSIGEEVNIDDAAHEDLVIHIAKARLIRIDARNSSAKSLSQVAACGERRRWLPILEGEFPSSMWTTSIQMHGEISSVFAVPDSASELYLRYSDGSVVFVPLHFTDDAITIVKP